MDANLIHKDEVFAIVGCAMSVLNGIGHGFHEKPYENALAVELSHQGVPVAQQSRFPISWREVQVVEYIPDLIACGLVVIETKTIDRITDIERGQMLNYLKITGHPVGVILNFKHPKLMWERVVLTKHS